MPNVPIDLKCIDIFVFRAPIEQPVVNSFGALRDRPSLLVRLEDRDGAWGWGETWCNFPTCGAEHRARLLETVLAPLLLGKTFSSPGEVFDHLTRITHILALQTGEPGPFAQTIAGIDGAVWDLAARKAGLALHRFLDPDSRGDVPTYASGISPTGCRETVAGCRAAGFRRFKLKVGFDRDGDFENLRKISERLGQGEELMIDVNQGWTLPEAVTLAAKYAAFPLVWIEEPLRADRPRSEWDTLAAASPVPLAVGENIRGLPAFKEIIAAGYARYIQPDACKWGGVSGCFQVATETLTAGLIYCPHYLGGGIGMVTSAHLLAAAGGEGFMEIDANPNPLRELLADPYPALHDGRLFLTDKAGIGVTPLLDEVKSLRKFHRRLH